MGNTFRGGQDRPHRKVQMHLPTLGESLDFIIQLKDIHKEFGMEGAQKFIRKTEELQGFKLGDLDHFLDFVK